MQADAECAAYVYSYRIRHTNDESNRIIESNAVAEHNRIEFNVPKMANCMCVKKQIEHTLIRQSNIQRPITKIKIKMDKVE